jgi:hypothetical protein
VCRAPGMVPRGRVHLRRGPDRSRAADVIRAKLGAVSTAYRVSSLREASCGLELTLEDGGVVKTPSDDQHGIRVLVGWAADS